MDPFDPPEPPDPPGPPGGRARAFRFRSGDVLANRYRVLAPIARGGLGEVYRAEDLELDELLALKVLSSSLAADAAALARFHAEVRNARRVSHPNICRTFDFGVHRESGEDVHFLTMELLTGEGLERRLARGPLAPGEFVEVMAQVATAVGAAHRAGVVHRDLKPSNVMLVPTPTGVRAVVTDFGIARHSGDDSLTQDGWVGTPAYVAPEQLEGKKVGPAADLYALGVMLFEAASGRLPFEGASTHQMALQRLAAAPPKLRSVAPGAPEVWAQVVAGCLERDPADRFASAEEVAALLRGGDAVTRPSAGSASARRRRRLAGVALVVAVVVAGLGLARRGQRALPPRERVVRVEVVAAPGTPALTLPAGAPRFEAAAADVVATAWRRLETRRRFRVSGAEGGNVVARLTWRPAGPRVAARLEVGTGEWLEVVGEATADSMSELAQALLPALTSVVAEGQPGVELFPEEREELGSLAAPDADAYKALVEIFETQFRTFVVEDGAVEARLDALVAKHPDWAQLAAYRAWTLPEAQRTQLVEASLAAASRTGRDPVGIALLEYTRSAKHQAERRLVRDQVFEKLTNRIGLLGRTFLANQYDPEDVAAASAELARRFPHLQFGMATTSGQQDPASAEKALVDWLARSPGQLQAWLSLLRHAARMHGQAPADFERAFLLLFGHSQLGVVTLAQLHLSVFDLERARRLASGVVAAPSLMRFHALYVLGEVDLLSGRFGAALERFSQAWETAEAAPALAAQFNWVPAARELLRLAEVLGRRAEAEQWRARLRAQLVASLWPAAVEAAFAWERAHAEGGRCVEPRAVWSAAPEGAPRREAERLVTRAAAAGGCASCEPVLAAGLAPSESGLWWTTTWARCAVEGGVQLAEVPRALSSATAFELAALSAAPEPSGFDVARGALWLGRAAEARGDAAEARAHYQRLLRFWGEAEVPQPEVAQARQRLAALPR